MIYAQTHLTRSLWFWIAVSFASLIGFGFAWYYFPVAFPLVDIKITTDRREALEAAKKLSEHYQWGPSTYQQAISFQEDSETKNFIELEGGGKKKLSELIEQRLFYPYMWRIRHFKEHEREETTIYLTPDGKNLGFVHEIPEQQPGAALSPEQARAIAESFDFTAWNINFSSYAPIETSQVTQPNGRIDHTFVYENPTLKVGEGTYRLKIEVVGDHVSELNPYIKVPEAFQRRYEHMRSANNTLAFTATLFMIFLYVLIGCTLGLWFLSRHHLIIWRPALYWALFIAGLSFLNAFNMLPLAWLSYDTAFAKASFLMNFFIRIITSFLISTSAMTLLFMVGEGLTRAAFGNHPQFWKVWNPEAAPSFQMFGRTLGGYLIVAFDFALDVLIYSFALRSLGWWLPSSNLIDPNILATYVPWLSSLSQSLSAGFLEEILFRAIPIAGAALIGTYFGRRNLFIGLAFIVQAIIFGAAHANYPAQPAYARLLELIIPSFVFGGLYIRYGLLPAIISHYIIDVIWMALPLFVAQGIWFNKLMVIIGALIPLLIVLRSGLMNGFKELSQSFYNKAWQRIKRTEKPLEQHGKPTIIKRSRTLQLSIIGMGIIGVFLWISTTRFSQDNLPLQITKAQALRRAKEELQKRGIQLEPHWKSFVIPEAPMNEEDRYVWQELGKSVYKKLMGNYLVPALWKVRFAQFQGDVVSRAEEYAVYVDGQGTVSRFTHNLPETKEGARLSEADARVIAHKVLHDDYSLDPNNLKEISAVSTKHPQRLDWKFIYQDPAVEGLKDGQARLEITIGGNEVIDHYRYVFVPEMWQRHDRNVQMINGIVTFLCILLFGLLIFGFIAQLVTRWTYPYFSKNFFIVGGSLIAALMVLQYILVWPSYIAQFTTSEPYFNQIWTLLGRLFLILCGYIPLLIFIIALATAAPRFKQFFSTAIGCMIEGILVGLFVTGTLSLVTAFIHRFIDYPQPFWVHYSVAQSYLAPLTMSLSVLLQYIIMTSFFLIVVIVFDYIEKKLSAGTLITSTLSIILGILFTAFRFESISQLLIIGLCAGLLITFLYHYVAKYHRAIIPFITATMLTADLIQIGVINAWHGVIIGALLACIFIWMVGSFWHSAIEHND